MERMDDSGKQNKLGTKIRIGGILFPSNVLMAPLAGYTCFPFRLMVEKLGAGSAYTEMVSSDGLKYNDRATSKLLYTDDREKLKCVQLLGSIPTVFERAVMSERLEKFDVIDINMGCPVPNVVKAGADGVMLARYGFENPLIFSELTGKGTEETKYSLIMEQLEIAKDCFDELFVLSYLKKLASYFMKKLPGTKQYKLDLYKCGSIGELKGILTEISGKES